jgi:hypothetical protein
MTQEIAVKNEDANNMIRVIERVAMAENLDVSRLEKMIDMQERILDRNAKQEFYADLAAMQQKLPRVVETSTGHNNAMYAKLEDINDIIRPTLHKFGFAVTFRSSQTEKAVVVVTVLSHRAGHSEETSIALPPDTSGNKTPVQAVGSSIEYGKRYGICLILNISTGKDCDGGTPSVLTAVAADWVAVIQDCTTLESLQHEFNTAFKDLTAKKDNYGKNHLIKAKDARKKELSNG